MILVLGFLVSLIPSIALFFVLRNIKKEDEEYKKICNTSFIKGVLSVFPVILLSAAFAIFEAVTHIKDANIVLASLFHKFIVLALAEEIVKFLTAKHVWKNNPYNYSWLDIIVTGTIVALAFGVAEDIPYAIGAGVGMMIVRGLCSGHITYGFITSYFYGKGLKENNKNLSYLGFIIAWLMHGFYDFGLTPELNEMNEWIGAISVLLAIFEFVFLIFIFFFVYKAKNKEKYTTPIIIQNTDNQITETN